MLPFLRTWGLFALTALAEIVGCFLPYLWLRKGASPWLLAPAAFSLAAFAWLLTLHPAAAGRTYTAYGGVYVSGAILPGMEPLKELNDLCEEELREMDS